MKGLLCCVSVVGIMGNVGVGYQRDCLVIAMIFKLVVMEWVSVLVLLGLGVVGSGLLVSRVISCTMFGRAYGCEVVVPGVNGCGGVGDILGVKDLGSSGMSFMSGPRARSPN